MLSRLFDLVAPLTTSDPLAKVHRLVRSTVPALDDDRPLSREIAANARMIASHELEDVVAGLVKRKIFHFQFDNGRAAF